MGAEILKHRKQNRFAVDLVLLSKMIAVQVVKSRFSFIFHNNFPSRCNRAVRNLLPLSIFPIHSSAYFSSRPHSSLHVPGRSSSSLSILENKQWVGNFLVRVFNTPNKILISWKSCKFSLFESFKNKFNQVNLNIIEREKSSLFSGVQYFIWEEIVKYE